MICKFIYILVIFKLDCTFTNFDLFKLLFYYIIKYIFAQSIIVKY